jgi:ribulose-phosphate 3-epimerase
VHGPIRSADDGNPGFGGQSFIPYTLQDPDPTHRRLARLPIEIDGGVTAENLAELIRAGVNWVVAGSSIFHSPDATTTVSEMIRIANQALAVQV